MLNKKTPCKAAWSVGLLLSFLLLLPVSVLAQMPPRLEPFAPRVNDEVHAAELVDGRFWIGGRFTEINGSTGIYQRLARIKPDGSLDTGLVDLQLDEAVHVIKYDQGRGHIYVGGKFTQVRGSARPYIFRLKRDGSLDTSFRPLSGTSTGGDVRDLLVQPDGKLVIVGGFQSDSGSTGPKPPSYVARLHADGRIDTGFNPPVDSIYYGASAVARQSNGKLLVGANFSGQSYLQRLHPNGQLDESFASTIDVPGYSGYPVYPSRLHVQSDDRIVMTGWSGTNLGAYMIIGAMRLMPDGELDSSFQPFTSLGPNFKIRDIVPFENGSWLIAGNFIINHGNDRYYHFARLNSDGSLNTDLGSAEFNDSVNRLLPLGSRVLAVGGFTYGFTHLKRENIALLQMDLDAIFKNGFEEGEL